MTLERLSCSCSECRLACTRMPGLFRPGEIAQAAALLGMSDVDFTDQYVAGCKTHRGTIAAIPRIVGTHPGTVYRGDTHGPCVFLEGGRCRIYAARPYECAHGNPCDRDPAAREAYYAARDETARLWGSV